MTVGTELERESVSILAQVSRLKYRVYGPVGAIALRGFTRMVRRPSLLMPVVVMPLFFLVAFTGAFDALGQDPRYGTDNVVDWMLPWAALQGAAFAGVGAAGFTAEDLENGFYDRVLTAPLQRWVLVGGIVTYAVTRALIPISLVAVVGIFMGATYPGGLVGVGTLYLGAICVTLVVTFLSSALVYWLRTQRALALVQILVFVSLFLSIGQVPLRFIQGWLQPVARINPITNIIRLARQGMIGDVIWADTWPGLVATSALCLVLGSFTYVSLNRLTR